MSRRAFPTLVLVFAACWPTENPLQPTPPSARRSAAAGYEAIDLGTLGGNSSTPSAINKRGQVVGWSTTADGANHAFLWADGVMTDLGTLAGGQSFAQAINDRGEVAGVSVHSTDPDDVDLSHVVVWENGAIHNLGPRNAPPGWFSAPLVARVVGLSPAGDVLAFIDWWNDGHSGNAVILSKGGGEQDIGGLARHVQTYPHAWNKRGQVVGASHADVTGFGPEADFLLHPFLWENGVMRDLGVFGRADFQCGEDSACAEGEATDINAGGVAVGWSADMSRTPRAFVWDGQLRDLGVFPGEATTAVAINERGQVTGRHGARAFLWEAGGARDLGTLGGTGATVTALNNAGAVVGSSLTASGEQHAFVWHDGVMIDLGLGFEGAEQSWAIAINERGDVLGVARDCDANCEYSSVGTRRAILWRRVQTSSEAPRGGR
jgi:probable HAF family extracellular repeat protein